MKGAPRPQKSGAVAHAQQRAHRQHVQLAAPRSVGLAPDEPVRIDILREICERFVFVRRHADRTSRLQSFADLRALAADEAVRKYLGTLAERAAR